MTKNIHSAALRAIAAALVLLTVAPAASAQEKYEPAKTCQFAEKDGQALLLDVYPAAEGSETSLDGQPKPSIVFMFGGGFISGERNADAYKPWFKELNDNGYCVISIDYRCAMKGVKTRGGVSSVKQFHNAVTVAAEDLFSATKYLIDNASELNIDPNNLVIAGSSAGAMSVLQAEWLLCNSDEVAGVLPEGFNYAGVMAFAGAILSDEGLPKYAKEPAPIAFFHGTADKVVNYKSIRLFDWAFAGSDKLAKIFDKNGYAYNIYRFEGNKHEIAEAFMVTFPEQIRFLETNVIRKSDRIIDMTVLADPDAPEPSQYSDRGDLYSE